MTVYVAWTTELPEEDLAGPWTEIRVAAPGLLLVDSDDTLSRVFHELKWALPDRGRPAVRRPDRRAPRSCGASHRARCPG